MYPGSKESVKQAGEWAMTCLGMSYDGRDALIETLYESLIDKTSERCMVLSVFDEYKNQANERYDVDTKIEVCNKIIESFDKFDISIFFNYVNDKIIEAENQT